jgi:uncharacterized membrane protein
VHRGLLIAQEIACFRGQELLFDIFEVLLLVPVVAWVVLWVVLPASHVELGRQLSPVPISVKVGAFKTFEAFLLFTRLRLVYERMELLLFPTMAVCAFLKSLTALGVASDEGAALPVFA